MLFIFLLLSPFLNIWIFICIHLCLWGIILFLSSFQYLHRSLWVIFLSLTDWFCNISRGKSCDYVIAILIKFGRLKYANFNFLMNASENIEDNKLRRACKIYWISIYLDLRRREIFVWSYFGEREIGIEKVSKQSGRTTYDHVVNKLTEEWCPLGKRIVQRNLTPNLSCQRESPCVVTLPVSQSVKP